MTNPNEKIDWRTIIRRIKTGKFTPIISYRVSSDHFLEGYGVVESWAEKIAYPLKDKDNLARVAQFVTVQRRDTLSAKEEYLDYLKEALLDLARKAQTPEQAPFLDTLADELYDLPLSEVARRLAYPGFADSMDNPLRILAEFPIPIYVTTNYCTLMEDALKHAGKSPRTEICYWHEDLSDDVVSVFTADPDYQPTEAEPLVFHIHGLDTCPASLVLTEDDYLDFLVKVSEDPEAVPRRVGQALTDSSLLLLGYTLQGVDFKVIFRGLIRGKRDARRLLSLAIQLSPEETAGIENEDEARVYLSQYFEQANFDVYWGNVQAFTRELWENWGR